MQADRMTLSIASTLYCEDPQVVVTVETACIALRCLRCDVAQGRTSARGHSRRLTSPRQSAEEHADAALLVTSRRAACRVEAFNQAALVFACCWPVWGRVCGGAAFHSPPPPR